MRLTDPSTKTLPVSLQLCHISSSSTGLFRIADREKMVNLGIYSPAAPLQWVGDVSCMSAKQSHPCGPAQWWLRPTRAFLSCVPCGQGSGKASAYSSLSSLSGPPQVATKDPALPAWPLVPQGSSDKVRLQPTQLPPKLLRSPPISLGLLSHRRITNMGKLERRNPEGAKLKPRLVRGVTWAARPPWEETAATVVLGIGFLPGKYSKWEQVIRDASTAALCQGPNIGYVHSLGVLAGLNPVLCRCWHNFPSLGLFLFTWSNKGPCGW